MADAKHLIYLVDDDDFFTALFAIVIHTAGINMTPFEMPVLFGAMLFSLVVIPTFGTLYMTCSLAANDRHESETFAALMGVQSA